MYSIVLMAAMTTGAEVPDCGHGWGGWGGWGGCWGGYYGCYGGYGYYGYTGYRGRYLAEATDASAAPARIVVNLPADAKLTIDGVPTTSTSAERVFVSPDLPPDHDYHYTLEAEVMRDGKPVRVEQAIQVRAGRESRVTLILPEGVASK